MNDLEKLRSTVVIGVEAAQRFVVQNGIASQDMPNFHAPETLSVEANTAISEFTLESRNVSMPLPSDLQGWKEAQRRIELDFNKVSVKVKQQYRPEIKAGKLGGVPILDIRPQGWADNNNLLIYTHGGAYTLFSAHSTLNSAVPVAHDTGLRVISIDYTLAPQSQWNEITDQVIEVIQALSWKDRSLSNIAIYGDSAGGSLAAGAVLKMRDNRLGMPAAVVLRSPWSDIADKGDTYSTLQQADPLLYYPLNLARSADAYAAKPDQKNPYVSPVYGNYTKGFPPTLIQVGTKEIFLSNAVRHYQALDNARIDVKLDPYEGMWHLFAAFNWNLPESKLARSKMAAFLKVHLET